ncbi:MAG: GNAT family N-acetyltransferase [Crocinitomicaceae bacterium]|nr:GNAT family N-acetyltransferase [Crocinitomicaceae bacterium]
MKTLETERLILRPLTTEDVNEVFFLRSDEIVGQYIKREKLKGTDGAMRFIKRINREVAESKIYYWVISTKSSKKMIGSICLWNFSEDKTKAEVGYDLHPDAQGKGFMHETIMQILRFAFDNLILTEVSAYTDYRNSASIKLLEKNNFKIQPELRDKGNENNRVFIISNESR